MWALSGGNTECVKVLLNRGAQANQQDKVKIASNCSNVCYECVLLTL